MSHMSYTDNDICDGILPYQLRGISTCQNGATDPAKDEHCMEERGPRWENQAEKNTTNTPGTYL